MNKRIVPLVITLPLILSSCVFTFSERSDFVPSSQDDSSEQTPQEIIFNVVSARFTDQQGHLTVNYTCNLGSPFDIDGHLFSKLNVTGVTVSELNTEGSGYFTLLSPIVSASLKFEFYDSNNVIYISKRYESVEQYVPGISIDYPDGYSTLYWHDEFEGNSLDTSKWTYEIGNGNWGWGNGESQYYTDYNDTVNDGVLTISGKKENVDEFNYTSTRIKTQNKVRFTYGYVEAKIMLPAVNGMWPAFWMMPNDSSYGGWPHSGEIDIMEARGRISNVSSSAIHFSKPSGDHTYKTEEKTGHNIAEWHKYAVEWKKDTIAFFVDDECYYTVYKNQWSTANAQDSDIAPFDKDFYIVLNLAIGGHFDNYTLPPEGFTSADMKVDYVRVFK